MSSTLRRRALVRAIGLGVVWTVPAAVLAYLVRAQVGPVVRWDADVVVAATDITRASPGLQRVLLVWQEAFRAPFVNLAVTVLCVWLWRRRGMTSRAAWGFVTLMLAWLLGNGLKELVGRARPVVQDAVDHAPGFSFPSGHALNTAAAGLVVALLVWPLLGRRGRSVTVVVVTLVVLLTGVDRVMLGAHFPSDVVAGLVLGTAMVGASYAGYRGWTPAPTTAEA
ncbi:MAG: phosphatase PAP2 family protein [Cellulomonadaceae bacterium]|nr:phosphatase PAP2 family protein [Cellulomonadaceae bacterium]